MTLQDWAAIATIFEAFGTVAVGFSALVVSFVALRTQREALLASVKFGFMGSGFVDSDGVRWVMAWMRNRGVTVYVRDVYPCEWEPLSLRDGQFPDVARVGKPGSMPELLRSKSKRELREKGGVFEPGYLPSGQYLEFYVSCPPVVKRLKLAATISVKRRGGVRFISSKCFEVPSAEELTEAFLETRTYFELQASCRNGPVGPAGGAED